MKVFVVRLSSNKELVGLFTSPSLSRLWRFVDEACDPFVCEFVELGPGGLFLPHAGAPRVPTAKRFPTEEKDIPDWFAGATLSELWMDAFYDEVEWLPIEPPEDEIVQP